MRQQSIPPTFQNMPPEAVDCVWRQRFNTGDGILLETDPLAIEEPLQISLQWTDSATEKQASREWSLTMRTPGDDVNLVTGLLLTQQVITDLSQIMRIEMADCDTRHAGNHLLVTLAPGIEPDWGNQSRRYVSQSSCGICGMTSMRALNLAQHIVLDDSSHWLDPQQVIQMPDLLASHQPLFEQTGAVHGAGYLVDGRLIAVAEDVGRHNALDKLLGHILSAGLWDKKGVLVLSGRISFELMQKALLGRVAAIVAVGAPSRLAVDMARQFDMTLIGFTRQHQFNIYHGQHRLHPVK